MVLIMHDGVFLLNAGGKVIPEAFVIVPIPGDLDPEDQGMKAFNYRSEPFCVSKMGTRLLCLCFQDVKATGRGGCPDSKFWAPTFYILSCLRRQVLSRFRDNSLLKCLT
jgi:hypothetical protein